MFRAGVKWHEEGENNTAYFLGLMNSKYSRLELNKVTDEAGTATDHKTINEKKRLRSARRDCVKTVELAETTFCLTNMGV